MRCLHTGQRGITGIEPVIVLDVPGVRGVSSQVLRSAINNQLAPVADCFPLNPRRGLLNKWSIAKESTEWQTATKE